MKNNNKVSLLRRRKTAMDWIKKYLVLIIGSLIYSAGLEIFLVPNNIIDGGVVGIGRYKNLIALLQSAQFYLAHENEFEGIQSASASDTVFGADECCVCFLELLKGIAVQIPATV